MRLAIIDLGTNSVRFDVHQISSSSLKPGLSEKRLHREKLMVRLGQNVFTRGKLDPAAMARTVEAFRSFSRTLRDLKVDRVLAFATSALREASDSTKLIERVRARTGIELRVISGVEEARLIALGFLANTSPPEERFGLIDIGGGSTEVSIIKNKETLHSTSFNL